MTEQRKMTSFNPQEIETIVFDFGGVLLNIDFLKTIKAFEELGVASFTEQYSAHIQAPLFRDLETGKITPQQFREGLRVLLGKSISDSDLDKAWNALLLDMPDERVTLLEKAKKHYRLFLLSNTNIIHYQKYNTEFNNRYGKDLDDLFEKAYWSFQIEMRKPNLEIYSHVVNSSHLNASKTLFIDDSLLNITSANECGMNGYHLLKDVKNLFNEEGKLKDR